MIAGILRQLNAIGVTDLLATPASRNLIVLLAVISFVFALLSSLFGLISAKRSSPLAWKVLAPACSAVSLVAVGLTTGVLAGLLANHIPESALSGLDPLNTAPVVEPSEADWNGGWGDSGNGRPSYTIDEINRGALGDAIVFDSISDSKIGDEKNFVAARENTGINQGANNVWKSNEIEVEPGKTYYIRLYVHNNSPKAYGAVAKDVTVDFYIPNVSEPVNVVTVNGHIKCPNATPDRYWDGVRFVSDEKFHLEYVPGSAQLENTGVGAGRPCKLSDSIVSDGVTIGYESLNGEIPGCYQFDSIVAIEVEPVFEGIHIIPEDAVAMAVLVAIVTAAVALIYRRAVKPEEA